MNIVRAAFLLSLVGTAAGVALAQGPMPARIVPTNFMSQRQDLMTNVPNDPRFASMQAISAHYAPYYFPYQNNPTPENAANLVCDMILANKAAGHINNDNICVLIGGLGHDAHNSQPGWVDPPGNDPTIPQDGM